MVLAPAPDVASDTETEGREGLKIKKQKLSDSAATTTANGAGGGGAPKRRNGDNQKAMGRWTLNGKHIIFQLATSSLPPKKKLGRPKGNKVNDNAAEKAAPTTRTRASVDDNYLTFVYVSGAHQSSACKTGAVSIVQTLPTEEPLDLVFQRDNDKWPNEDSWDLPALSIDPPIKTLTDSNGGNNVEPSVKTAPLVDLLNIGIDDFFIIRLASFLEEMTAEESQKKFARRLLKCVIPLQETIIN